MNEKLKIERIYPLTPMQEGMLYHYLYEKHGEAYVNQLMFTIEGELNVEHFEQATNQLIMRHEALRTNFVYENLKNPQQVVFEKRTLKLDYDDVTLLQGKEKEKRIKEYAFREKERPFDLIHDMLVRITVLKIEESLYRVIWTFHHIIMDGWCNSIIIRELLSLYSAINQKKEPELKEVPNFSSYISWIKGTDKVKTYTYWKEYLKNYEENQTGLPKKQNAGSEYEKREKKLIIPQDLTKMLSQICMDNQVTMNSMLESLWGVLLQKINSVEDVVFGAIVSGRPSNLQGIESMVGNFIHIVPVRVKKGSNEKFVNVLQSVQEEALASLPYQYASLAEIQANIGNRNLINHIMVFENYPQIEDLNAFIKNLDINFSMSDFYIDEQTNYDLNLIVETGDTIQIHFDYNGCVYDDDTICYLMQYLMNIIIEVTEEHGILLDNVQLATKKEQEKIRSFNRTEKEFNKERLLHSYFEEQAKKNPDKTAITYDGKKMSYQELNEKSNQLARVLLSMGGKGADNFIAICLERSFEMMIGILAILKSGGAYMPIDPFYPEDRVNYILDNSKCKFVLTKKEYLNRSCFNDVTVICVDEAKLYQGNGENVSVPISSSNLAYVIYTSGSTGKPKGVMIEHRAIINRILWMRDYYQFTEQDQFLQKTPFTFDVSVWELFLWSFCGGSLHFTRNGVEKDAKALIHAVEEYSITAIHFVPSMFSAFIDYIEVLPEYAEKLVSLNHVFTSGEALLPIHVEKFFNMTKSVKSIALNNLYGPTEAAVDVTYYKCERDEQIQSVAIGKPIDNIRIYVVDSKLNMLPVGVAGELCIAGIGLARGYVNNPELTAKKFIPCPFETNESMYKTGDLARWKSDGNIEYLGRIDRQVKLHGNRIELGEIENVLGEIPFIKQGVVTVCENAQGKHLCAYVIEKESEHLQEIKDYLKSKLPSYMVPTYYIPIDKIPLTDSGKVNYKALPEYKMENKKELVLPETELETKLLDIWKDVLNIETISVTDSFFELGGHSLLLVRLISRIQKDCNASLNYQTFIENNSIREVARKLENCEAEEEVWETIVPDKENIYEPFMLTDIQFAYYVGRNDNVELGGVSTHGYIELETSVDITRFEMSLNKVIERHPGLRTIFGDDGKQRILRETEKYHIATIDMVNQEQVQQYETILKLRDKMSHAVFDPAQWPLFDIKAIRLEENMYHLFISIDMLIADEMSLKIIYHDFLHYYYKNEELEPLMLTFRDYVINVQKIKQTKTYEVDKEYWTKKLDEFPGAPKIPLLQNAAKLEKVTFNRKRKLIEKETTQALKHLAVENKVTLSSLLMGIYAKVLEFFSGGETFSINMTVFNRLPIHKEVNQIVGDFTSVLPVEVVPNKEKTFWDTVHGIQKEILEGMEHRTYSGVEFIRELGKKRKQTNQAIMPIVFTSTLTDESGYVLDEGSENILDFKNVCMSLTQTSQVWIDCAVSEIEGQICINWNYVNELFDQSLIDTMFTQLVNTIEILSSKKMFVHLKASESDQDAIAKYNRTEKEFEDITLTELFNRTAAKYPDKVAVSLEEEAISYRELDEKSNQIARYLQQNGIGAGAFVGVEAKRVIETIINIIGVLKSGAAYVPIDPEYPQVRCDYIRENSRCDIFLKPDSYRIAKMDEFDCSQVRVPISTEQTAYVIYTSGTTGQPKGVMITHKGAVNTILDINQRYQVTKDDKILGISSMCFDLSVYDIFGALSTGATLVMVENQRDIKKVSSILKKEQITIWNSVPATFQMLVMQMEEEEEKKKKYFWSPVTHWEIKENKLWIDDKEYPETDNKYFPEFYFLAQKGITKQAVLKHFENGFAVEIEEMWNTMLQQKVLIDRILTPSELYVKQDLLYDNKEDEEILFDTEKYKEYKQRQLTRSGALASNYVVNLNESKDYPDWIEHRKSYRKFDENTPISFRRFSKMLSIFKQKKNREEDITYYYASAGGLYAIDIYIYVKEERVEGMQKGLYYYDACCNALKLVDSQVTMDNSMYMYTNKEIFDSAAFSVFFIYNADASMPKYHSMGYYMSGIDAGIMVATMTQSAQLSDIGLCSIGSMDFEKIKDAFHLKKNQVLLHSVLGGLKCDAAEEEKCFSEVNPYSYVPQDSFNLEKVHNSLRLVMLSGDWIPVTLPSRIKEKFHGVKVVSLGGATEASIWSIFYEITDSMKGFRSVPYGMPLSNQSIYILNEEHEICPISVMGEIFIGGKGVAQGYQNQRQLTEMAFFYDEKLGYIYATGDYGVYRKEGYVEFLGRKDQQVKIKGHRIELSEIEMAILDYGKVSQVIALVCDNSRGYKQIVACIVPMHNENITKSEMEEYMKTRLPYYMIPSQYIFLENMPLTANGKIDRKALLEVQAGCMEEDKERIEPQNEVEQRLLLIWKHVFGMENISTTDNFFEIGGDSLTIMMLSERITNEFNVKLTISKLFSQPTIQRIAEQILEEQKKQEELDELALELMSLTEEERESILLDD